MGKGPLGSRRAGPAVLTHPLLSPPLPSLSPQQFGKILDVEIIFNERGSKVGAAQRRHHYSAGCRSRQANV